jgi:hypothetical protein
VAKLVDNATLSAHCGSTSIIIRAANYGGRWTCGGKSYPCWDLSSSWRCSGQRSCMFCRDRGASDSERTNSTFALP